MKWCQEARRRGTDKLGDPPGHAVDRDRDREFRRLVAPSLYRDLYRDRDLFSRACTTTATNSDAVDRDRGSLIGNE